MSSLWESVQRVTGRWSNSGHSADDLDWQEALLKDRSVMEAVRVSAGKALMDPAVQRAVIDAAKKKGPELAGPAVQMVSQWASDPHVQARAKHMAGVAATSAWNMGEAGLHCIEQGPQGVQFLAFLGGIASLVLAGLQVLNPLAVLGATFTYAVSLYQVLFSLITMLFEARTEWISQYDWLNDLSDMLMLNMRFLSLSLGRGLFYIFQGSIWWVLSSLSGFPQKVLALYLCGLGALYVCMHFGMMPQHVATKMRSTFAASGDYLRVM